MLNIFPGGPISVMSPLAVKILGFERAPFGLGMVFMIYGIGSIIGPPLTGKHTYLFLKWLNRGNQGTVGKKKTPTDINL